MKRTFCGLFLIFLMVAMSPETAAADGGKAVVANGRSEHGPLVRIAKVEGRGLLNIVGLPAEIFRTGVEEARHHHWLWPFTYVPRLLTYTIIRVTSAAYDIVFMPFVAPFTADLSPLTEPMDLPEYPWQSS